MNKFRRRQLFVDTKVQTGILVRIAVYWVFSVLFITLPLAFVYMLFDTSQLWIQHVVGVWQKHWPIFVTMTLMLPFAFYDFLKYSNRFVGPIYRLRMELEKIKKSGQMREIRFRDNDYWPELAEGFSMLTARVKELEEKLKAHGVEPGTAFQDQDTQQPTNV